MVMNVKSAFILWQDLTQSRMWKAVAKLTQQDDGQYEFFYTQGAKHKNFHGFAGMEDKTRTYKSEKIFTFLRNRILPESRPEHDKMFSWLELSLEEKDYFSLLALSGGEKKTDYLRLINIPTIENGVYKTRFFVSSINYLTNEQKSSLLSLQVGDLLTYQFDQDNPIDKNAIMLFNHQQIGYLPAYLCEEFKKILGLYGESDLQIKVVKYNIDAPMQYQVLCELTVKVDDNYEPFNRDDFRPIQ